MIYVEAPDKTYHKSNHERPSFFLAGGITNCPDWQSELVSQLEELNLDIIVYNPRRKNFPIDDSRESRMQIEWEYNKLRSVHAVIFWFSYGSLNPIVLFEYGSALERFNSKDLIVGCHPDYVRRRDVEIQSKLRHKTIEISYKLTDIAKRIKNYPVTRWPVNRGVRFG